VREKKTAIIIAAVIYAAQYYAAYIYAACIFAAQSIVVVRLVQGPHRRRGSIGEVGSGIEEGEWDPCASSTSKATSPVTVGATIKPDNGCRYSGNHYCQHDRQARWSE